MDSDSDRYPPEAWRSSPSGEVFAAALEVAERIAAKAPVAVRESRGSC